MSQNSSDSENHIWDENKAVSGSDIEIVVNDCEAIMK